MTSRYVYGIYEDVLTAEKKADTLIERGIPMSAVSLISNKEVASNNESTYHRIHYETVEDNRNWFQKLFGLEGDPSEQPNLDFDAYSTTLAEGKVLLVLDNEHEVTASQIDPYDVEINQYDKAKDAMQYNHVDIPDSTVDSHVNLETAQQPRPKDSEQ